jgi:dolichyl-phosphate-mannose-protein mannosyltransferase
LADTNSHQQLSQYVTDVNNFMNTAPTEQAQIHKLGDQQQQQAQEPAAEIPQQQQLEDQAAVTQPKLSGSVARVEYRDQHGNVLPEDVVASLRAEGKVKFETRYESRSKLEHAQEIPIVDGQLAPPHPDVQGQNPETGSGKPEDSIPPESPASVIEGNVRSEESTGSPEAKPASEGYEATK